MRKFIFVVLMAGLVGLAWVAKPGRCAWCSEGATCSKFAPAMCGPRGGDCFCLVTDASGNGVCASAR